MVAKRHTDQDLKDAYFEGTEHGKRANSNKVEFFDTNVLWDGSEAKKKVILPGLYGSCPHCGARVTDRERRPDGDDICENGHKYPSKSSVRN